MEKLTIILNDHGLRYASALVSTGVQLDLFWLADGVAPARRGQKTPTGYSNVADTPGTLNAKAVEC